MDTSSTDYSIMLKVWNRYLTNKSRYEKGVYKESTCKGIPKKMLTQLRNISLRIQKYNADVDHWVDSQFNFFYLSFEKIPYINQLYSEGAYKRYLDYMRRNGANECVERNSRDISFSAYERVSYGKAFLKKLKKLHPELSRNMIVKLFADQFPEEFLVWYANEHAPSIKQKVLRVLSSF